MVLVVVFAFGLGILAMQSRGGPSLTYRSAAGGFDLSLPGGWRLRDEAPDSPVVWVEAEHPTRVGPADAWMWVARLQPVGDEPLAFGRNMALEDIRRRWGDVDVEESRTAFAGQDAIRLHYVHPVVRDLGFLPASDAEEVRFVTSHAGQVYEIGMAGWRRLPLEARDLEQHVRLHTPTGSRTMLEPAERFVIEVPASWNWTGKRDDMPDAVWIATSPPSVPDEWGILWKYDVPLDDAVEASAAKAEREGTLIRRSRARIDGRSATRIDFEKPTDRAGLAYDSTWLFEGPDDRTWQLLIGSMRPNSTAGATRVAAGLSFT